MKRRILSIVMALALCLVLLPGAVLAADTPEDKSGGWVYNDYKSANGLPTQNTVYSAGGGTITWEPVTVWNETYNRDIAISGKLILNNAAITVNAASSQGIYVPVDTELVLVGTNTITVNQSGTAIMVSDPYYGGKPSLTIKGEGSLTIHAAGGGDGIQVSNELNIVEGANVTVTCPAGGVGMFTVHGGISICDSTVKVKIAEGKESRGAIRAVTNGYPADDLTIENSHVTAINPGGTSMMSSHSISSTNSDVVAIGKSLTDGDVPVEGILDFAELSGGTVTISGGTLYAQNNYESQTAYNYGYDLPVLEGKITATDSAVIYYKHAYRQLIQGGNNIQYANCSYNEAADMVTSTGYAFVMGTVEWNKNIIWGVGINNYNQILSSGNVAGNIIIPSGVTATIPSSCGLYNYGTITNNGTIVIENEMQNVVNSGVKNSTGTIINNGTITVKASGSLLSNGTVTNSGTLNIEGRYNNFPTGKINGGTINGVVLEYNTSVSPKQFFFVAHGDAKLYENDAKYMGNKDNTLLVGTDSSADKKQTVTVPADATLTIQENCILDASQTALGLSWETLDTYLSVAGKIVVNGTLKLPANPIQEKLDALLTHISGTGQVIIGESTVYPVTVTGGTADKGFAKAGETVTLTPEAGQGEVFRGWTTSPSVTITDNTFTMPGQAVTVTARYDYTVAFDSQGGSTVESQTVESGGKATTPTTAPTRTGHTFGGWYTDALGTTAYNFNSTVTAPLTLYAKWIPDKHTVTFDSQEGSAVASVQADYGTKLTRPTDPTKDGYTFGGWYKEADCTTAWDFGSDTVTEDVTLYAKWTVQSKPSGGSGTPSLPVTTTGQNNEDVTTTTTAAPSAVTKGDTATTAVNSSMGSEIVKQAVANNSETVVIAPKVTGDVTRTEVSIPAATVGQLGSRTEASLTVSTPVADVTIPNGALSSLAGAGGSVAVTAEVKGNTVELSLTAGGETVERIPGGVILTVPAENTTPGTVAVLVHEDGTREVVRKSVAGDGSITIPLEDSARLEIVDNSKSFDDVPEDSWAADAVAFASAHELFNGTGASQFSPEAPMTRGMLAVVLHNLESNPAQTLTGAFADVDNSQWYAEGVAWAASQGIVGGYGNGMFGPDDNITREQLAAILWRYAGSPAATDKQLRFTDADEAGGYALEALCWATEKGIVQGKGDGILDPKGSATRAEGAAMLMRFLSK